MEQIKYNFTWEKHVDHFRDVLYNMMNTKILTDVTLVCDDQQEFRAHKVILSACSPVFARIIEKVSNKDSVIYLRGIYSQEMKAIMDFVYLGQTLTDKAFVEQILHTARNLEIKDLCEKDIQNSEENDTNQGGNDIESLSNKCPEPGCRKVFTMREFMLRHFKAKHTKETKDFQTSINGDFQQHSLLRDGNELVKDYTSANMVNLSGHTELEQKLTTIHPSNFEAVYDIESEIIHQDQRMQHQEDIKTALFKEQNGLFFCNQCTRKYTSERYIRFHIQSTH